MSFDVKQERKYIRRVEKVEKYLFERGFEKLGEGASRYVMIRDGDDYVIKIPVSYLCQSANINEYKAWKRSHDPRYAACRLFWMFDVPLIMMERVDPIFTPSSMTNLKHSDEYIRKWIYSIPTWSFYIDHIQVGVSRADGRICAFDYPNDVLNQDADLKQKRMRMNDKTKIMKHARKLSLKEPHHH